MGVITIHYNEHKHGDLTAVLGKIKESEINPDTGDQPTISEVGRQLLIPAIRKRLKELNLNEKEFFPG